jgi:hypothetical protein
MSFIHDPETISLVSIAVVLLAVACSHRSGALPREVFLALACVLALMSLAASVYILATS